MSQDRARTAAYVIACRGQRGLSQQRLAEIADVDVKTITSLETGRRWPQATNRAKIERALELPIGTLQSIAEGNDPPPLNSGIPDEPIIEIDDPFLIELLDELPYLNDDDRDLLARFWIGAKNTVKEKGMEINALRKRRAEGRRGA